MPLCLPDHHTDPAGAKTSELTMFLVPMDPRRADQPIRTVDGDRPYITF
jgi:hypothetical protein